MLNKFAVLGLGVVIFLSGCSSKDSATPSSSPTPTVDAPAIIKAKTKSFYDEYMLCMTEPPAAAKDNVGTYCQSHNSNATKVFPINLKLGGVSDAGADPIVCAQSFPESYSVGLGLLDPEGIGHAIVVEQFGGNSKVLVTAVLKNDSGEFLVDNIVCAIE